MMVLVAMGGIGWVAPQADADSVSMNDVVGTPDTTIGPYRLEFGHVFPPTCLSSPSRTLDGAWLEQTPCDDGDSSQLWTLQIASDGVQFRIRSPWSGKCVNIDHNVFSNGTHIIQWPCGVFQNEYFIRSADIVNGRVIPPGDYWWFASVHVQSMGLNVAGGSTAPRAKVILWQLGEFANEYIRLRPV